MLLFGKMVLSIFLSGSEEEVAAAMGTAYRYLSIMSCMLPVLYTLHVIRSALQGMGDTVMPMASGFAEFLMRNRDGADVAGENRRRWRICS